MTTLVHDIRPNLTTVKLYNTTFDWIALQNAAAKYIYRYNSTGNYAYLALHGISLELMYSLVPLTVSNRFGKFTYEDQFVLKTDASNTLGIELLDYDGIELFSQTPRNVNTDPSPSDTTTLIGIAPVVTQSISSTTNYTVQEAI